MTVIDNRTTNRDYPLPAGTNDLADDVLRIRSTFTAVDADMATVLASLASKAALSHTHIIANITGLQAALDSKQDVGAGAAAVAPINSPVFTGDPRAPTPTLGDADTSIATTAFVSATMSLGLSAKANLVHTHTVSQITDIATVGRTNNYADLAGRPALGGAAFRDSATTAELLANVANKVIETDKAWASVAAVALTYGATITADMKFFINAKVTLAGNPVLNFTNIRPGQSGRIEVRQDSFGNRLLSFTAGQIANSTLPVIDPASGARSVLYYDVLDDGKILLSLAKAVP